MNLILMPTKAVTIVNWCTKNTGRLLQGHFREMSIHFFQFHGTGIEMMNENGQKELAPIHVYLEKEGIDERRMTEQQKEDIKKLVQTDIIL